jgi:SAM-dependent methyltransferase
VTADVYAIAAEYYELWAGGLWTELGPVLRDALEGIDPATGPIVELGAGTGFGTVVIAEAVPAARIVAVEPSRAMRAVLVSRIVGQSLGDRVTVIPADFAGMSWPDRLAGFVAVAMLGHLTSGERVRLWGTLAARLAPDAIAVVHLQPPGRPEVIPPTRLPAGRLGDHEYEAWSQAEPVGARTMRWTMTYRVLRDGAVIDEQQETSNVTTVNKDDVVAEAAAVGLSAVEGEAGLVTLRRRAHPRAGSAP